MKVVALLGVIISILCLTCSCGGPDANILPDQNKAIENYLNGKKLEYQVMDGTYRYIANGDRDDRAQLPKAVNGDTVECYFEAYTFSSSPGNIFYTNKLELVADVEGLNTEYWNFNPLQLTVGSANIIAGVANGLPQCAKGDSIQLFMPSELGFGDKTLGLVPKNTALFYILNITDVKKQ